MCGVLEHERGSEGHRYAHHWLKSLATLHATSEGDPGYLVLCLAIRSLSELSAPQGSENALLAQEVLALWLETLSQVGLHSEKLSSERLVIVAQELKYIESLASASTIERLLAVATTVDTGSDYYYKYDRGRRLRTVAILALVQLGENAPLDTLLVAYDNVRRDDRDEVRDAIATLWEHKSPVKWLQVLANQGSGPAIIAASALTSWQDKSVIPAMEDVFRNASNDRRNYILRPLAALGDRDFVLKVVRDKSLDSKYIVEALATIGDDDAIAELRPFLQGPTVGDALRAGRAIGAQGGRLSEQQLRDFIKSAEWPLRLAAVSAVGVRGDRLLAQEILTAGCVDPDWDVKSEALANLRVLGLKVSLDLVTPNR